MCIRDRFQAAFGIQHDVVRLDVAMHQPDLRNIGNRLGYKAVSYTHLRAHETVLDLVCRLLLEKKKHITTKIKLHYIQKTPQTNINSTQLVTHV